MSNVRARLLGTALFLWLATYATTFLFSPWLARGVDAAVVALVSGTFLLTTTGRFVIRRLSVPIAGLVSAICFAWLKDDWSSPYTHVLYAKTLFYVPLSVLFAGQIVAELAVMPLDGRRYLQETLYGWTVAAVWALFLYLIFRYGWMPGQTLIGREIGEAYQGLSRFLGLAFLLLLFLGHARRAFLTGGTIVLCVTMIVAFNSMGAAFAILLAMAVWPFVYLQGEEKKGIAIIVVAAIIVIIYMAAPEVAGWEATDRFFQRATDKVIGWDSSVGRYQLMTEAVRLWFGGLSGFVFGPGAIEYACDVGFCSDYRHPHNYFANLVIWFGIFAIPMMLFVGAQLCKAMRLMYRVRDEIRIFYILLSYYGFLAMIGGDFEQNRAFVFFLTVGFLLNKVDKSWRVNAISARGELLRVGSS